MRHGLYLAPFGELADVAVLGDLAAQAEDAGFDGVFLWDHVLRPDQAMAVADPWIALAVIAMRTRRVRLGALVTPLARRRAQRVARETTTLDHLSGGRLVVGVGLGVDSGGELTRFGELVDERARAAALDEALDVLTGLWSGEPVHHHGVHVHVDGVRFAPVPRQRPRIPIWVAARTQRVGPMARAARFDGLCPETTIEGLAAMVADVAAHRGGLAGFDVVARGAPGDDPAPWAAAGATWWLTTLPVRSSAAAVRAVIAAGPPRGSPA